VVEKIRIKETMESMLVLAVAFTINKLNQKILPSLDRGKRVLLFFRVDYT
jgi:hypothetical protein